MLRVHLCNKSGVDCLQEHDNNWCNGDCDWIGGQCVQSNCDHEELIGDGYCNDETNNLGTNEVHYFLEKKPHSIEW